MPEWRAAMVGPRTSAKQLAPRDVATHARPSDPCAPLLNMVLTRLSSLLSSPSICLGLSFDSLRGGKTTVEDQRCNVKRHGLRKQAILECATAGDVKMMHELGGLCHFCGLEDHILQLGVLPLVATSSAGDRVVAGVFAACVAFDSCPPNASAAQKILTGSHAMATVHKRDYVVNFVNWFRLLSAMRVPAIQSG
ncbi:hypothetical protein V5799_004429 [Amblyomma americanum]|uniref:Uncharacterized protein n=1 Tax=Amblyomma americanum TaxID=6943 RepID=A0AAQ4D647_AMBAM